MGPLAGLRLPGACAPPSHAAVSCVLLRLLLWWLQLLLLLLLLPLEQLPLLVKPSLLAADVQLGCVRRGQQG